MNQHVTQELPLEWWSSAFRQQVASIGYTVLVLQPWSAPVPLTRSWCLVRRRRLRVPFTRCTVLSFAPPRVRAQWEIFSAVDGGCEMAVTLTESESAAFRDALVRDACVPNKSYVASVAGHRHLTPASCTQLNRFEDILRATSRIRVQDAHARTGHDEKMIRAVVEQSAGGFEAVNIAVHKRLRAWLVSEARALLQECRSNMGNSSYSTVVAAHNLGGLLLDQGRPDEAEPLYVEALASLRRMHGDTHPDTLGVASNLAKLRIAQGRGTEAEALLRMVHGHAASSGPGRLPSTVALFALHNHGIALEQEGKLAEAERAQREALAGLTRALGERDAATLTAANALAVVLRQTGALEEAEALCRRALRDQEAADGANYPRTLISRANLAFILRDRGKLAEAEAMQRDVLRARREHLGPTHPDTLGMLGDLANTLSERGRHVEAERYVREALDVRRTKPGPHHPDTLDSLETLAGVLFEQGRLREAEACSREALLGRRAAHGATHPDTLLVLSNLASTVAAQGRADEAAGLLRQALAAQRATLGDAHPSTRATAENLALLQRRQGRPAQ